MHELSVARGIMDTVLSHCQAPEDLRGIELDIGALSGVYPDSLAFYMDLILEEKQLPHVRVTYNAVPITYHCSCGQRYQAETITDLCPHCSSVERQITNGRDCIIQSIEVTE